MAFTAEKEALVVDSWNAIKADAGEHGLKFFLRYISMHITISYLVKDIMIVLSKKKRYDDCTQ
jgi:hypothetical protein